MRCHVTDCEFGASGRRKNCRGRCRRCRGGNRVCRSCAGRCGTRSDLACKPAGGCVPAIASQGEAVPAGSGRLGRWRGLRSRRSAVSRPARRPPSQRSSRDRTASWSRATGPAAGSGSIRRAGPSTIQPACWSPSQGASHDREARFGAPAADTSAAATRRTAGCPWRRPPAAARTGDWRPGPWQLRCRRPRPS